MLKNHQELPIKIPIERHTFAYLCYRCNKPGHFIKDCPETTPKRSSFFQPCSSTTSDSEFPTIHCRCGGGLCEIRVAASRDNPGRKYYRCPGKYDKHCGYFKWCDKLRADEIRKSQPEFNFPTCKCGAGVCTVRVEESGPNAGRSYFACPIKKGDGACDFRQWLDDSSHSAVVIPEDVTTEQNNLLEEFDLSHEEAMQIDALEMAAHDLPLEQVQIRMECSEGEKTTNRADIPSTEIHPQPVQNNTSQNTLESEMTTQSTMDDGYARENTQASITTAVATIHDPVVQDPLVDMLLQFLKAYLPPGPGSPGQIVDTPQRATITARSAAIRGPPSNFNQVTQREDNASAPSMILEDSSEERFEAPPSSDDQPCSGLLMNPSGILKDGLNAGSSMSGIILHAFENLAHHIRNKLITLLGSMDPMNHEIMLKEANCTFAALDHLQVDYGLFRVRVTECINQATSLADIEHAINKDTSSGELLRRYNNEKCRYNQVWDAYCNANDAYVASSQKLSVLHKNIAYFRDMSAESETELACSEAENARHRDSLHQISKTLSECKDSLQAAFQEASDALKLHEKREVERSAAKAAFEKAKAQLCK